MVAHGPASLPGPYMSRPSSVLGSREARQSQGMEFGCIFIPQACFMGKAQAAQQRGFAVRSHDEFGMHILWGGVCGLVHSVLGQQGLAHGELAHGLALPSLFEGLAKLAMLWYACPKDQQLNTSVANT